MKSSDSIAKLSAALVKAQVQIKFAAKDKKNPHFKNDYADLPSVITAVKPALNENGIAFIQGGAPSDDGKLHLTTRLMHESGEWIEDTLVMPLPKQDPQGFGSAMTYARRYALAAMTGVYQDDDDGNAGAGVQQKQQRQAPAKQAPAVLPMDEDELEGCISAMQDCDDMHVLQAIFGAGYKRGNADQKPRLQAVYEKCKKALSEP